VSAEPIPDSRGETEAVIRQFIARVFRDGSAIGLGSGVPLVTSGLVDSAGVLEVVAFLEDRFSIVVRDEDVTVEHFDSIGQLAAYVEMRRAG
jgi:acyl carrier protein